MMMRCASRIRSARRGLSMVEVLIAIAILVIGVIAVLRIFPVGYAAFNQSQQDYTAMKLISNWTNSFMAQPETLPDAILPVGMSFSGASASAINFADITAIDYRGATAGVGAKYRSTLFPFQDNGAWTAQWPLWLPVSVNTMRKVIGEKVTIPTGIGIAVPDPNDPAASLAKNVAFAPVYLPRFAPIVPNGYVDADEYGALTYLASDDPVTVYDLRYRQIPFTDENVLGETFARSTDKLIYAANYAQSAFYFPDREGGTVEVDRHIRTMLYMVDLDTGAVYPLRWRTPSDRVFTIALNWNIDEQQNWLQTLVCEGAPGGDVLFNMHVARVPGQYYKAFFEPDDVAKRGHWQIIPGSEQLNRQYTRWQPTYTSTDPEEMVVELADQLAALPSGYYYTQTPATFPSKAQQPILAGQIYFSRADAGRKVKLDYTVADWNILHDDLQVDEDGYLTLSLPNPKIGNRPNYPREPFTWGLYRPMDPESPEALHAPEGYQHIVMALVDLRTGELFHLWRAKGETGRPLYTITDALGQPASITAPSQFKQKGFNPDKTENPEFDQYTDLTMPRAIHGRVAIRDANGGLDGVRGRTFRVFYRARRDWTMQVLRTPASFWYRELAVTNPTANRFDQGEWRPGWQEFTIDHLSPYFGSKVYVVAPYLGQTVAVDYQYREWDEAHRLCTTGLDPNATDETIIAGPNLTVDDTSRLAVDMKLYAVNADDTSVAAYLGTVHQIIDSHTVKLYNDIDVNLGVKDNAALYHDEAPLRRVTGELHTVGPFDVSTAMFRLQHIPAPGTPIAMHGRSVMVRAIWAQERPGSVFLFNDLPVPTLQSLNERWRVKSQMILLPSVVE